MGLTPKRLAMRHGWLCMVPEKMTVFGQPVSWPDDVLAMCAVYRTKAAARKIHGRHAPLEEVRVP
jgi:hypothetical protein